VSVLDDLRWRKFPVLDQGSIAVIDAMGSDADIVSAARVSFGAGTRPISDDRTLLRYLVRRREMGPLEHAVLKLHWRVPLDTFRQVGRYRTMSISEYSTRYSEAIDAMQVTPADGWRLQSRDNKQGSGGPVTEWPAGWAADNDGWDVSGPNDYRLSVADDDISTPGTFLSHQEQELHKKARSVYEHRLSLGVAREQARKDLPLSTYTEAVTTVNLRNLLHACGERLPEHGPQQEIKSYFEVIFHNIITPLFPLVAEAFRDYVLGAITLTAIDMDGIRKMREGLYVPEVMSHVVNARERAEFIEKMGRIGFVPDPSA